MEAAKKPVNAAPATAAPAKNTAQPMPVKPAVKAETPKPPEKPDSKPAATAEKGGAEPKAETKPVVSAAPGLTPAAAVKAEQKEKLGTKLRRKGDILKVLRGGGHLVHTTEGLYRTPGALRALESAGQNPADFLERHLNCDWGNLDRDDIRENEYALQHGLRLLSSYHLNDGTRIWIITEADRSATTLLLPEEY